MEPADDELVMLAVGVSRSSSGRRVHRSGRRIGGYVDIGKAVVDAADIPADEAANVALPVPPPSAKAKPGTSMLPLADELVIRLSIGHPTRPPKSLRRRDGDGDVDMCIGDQRPLIADEAGWNSFLDARVDTPVT